MNSTAQPSHHKRMPLIEVPVVRDMTGLRRDEVFDRADGSSRVHRGFMWVWDFSTKFPHATSRNLRFWRAEIEAACSADSAGLRSFNSYELPWVINEILPATRQQFHSGEVMLMFTLSRNSLLRLRAELKGELRGPRNAVFPRDGLVRFLQRRWLGAAQDRRPA